MALTVVVVLSGLIVLNLLGSGCVEFPFSRIKHKELHFPTTQHGTRVSDEERHTLCTTDMCGAQAYDKNSGVVTGPYVYICECPGDKTCREYPERLSNFFITFVCVGPEGFPHEHTPGVAEAYRERTRSSHRSEEL